MECYKEFESTTRDHYKNKIHDLFPPKKNIKLITSCLTHMFEIGAEKESNLVINPNHKPLKGSLLSRLHLTIKHKWLKAFRY